MRILIIGVGDAFTARHFGSSALIEAPDGHVLIDCPDLIHRALRAASDASGNAGSAQVGNAGSRRILKYGPLGHTVNLASRVEGGTKHFGIPFLITGATRNELPDEFETRRVCQVRVVGISGTVDLHECRSPPVESARLALRDGYEGALELYERGSFDEATRILAALTAEVGAADQPCQILSELIERAREQRPDPFDPVFHLQSK